MQPLLAMDSSFKYNRTRSELLSRHFDDFIAIHKPYIENGFIPRRDEVTLPLSPCFSFILFLTHTSPPFLSPNVSVYCVGCMDV